MEKSIEEINFEIAEKGTRATVKKARQQHVYKANEIVQKKRFELSTLEQKIVAYMVSLIKPNQKDLAYVDASINDLCLLMGIATGNGKNIQTLKSTIRKLANKSEWAEVYRDGERCETLVRWIEKPTFYYRSGIVRLKLDEDLKPYLIGLENRYTKYELENILAMQSKYGIRLFELCKSFESQGFFEKTIEDLRIIFAVTGYKQWRDFKKNVIDVSVSEINRLTDINVTWKAKIKGKTTHSIVFCVRTKEGSIQFNGVKETREKELDKYLSVDDLQQISFDDVAMNDNSLDDFHDFYADALPLTETERHAFSRMIEEDREKKSGEKINP